MAPRNRSIHIKPSQSRPALTITCPNAAGIDIGSASHFVAVPPDRDADPVREFPSFTVDLNALADWLKTCGVDTVAMESTGVYWIALFELLQSRGFTVLLVNARHVKNVSGRKSDVLDCQWLQQLMTYGLLRGAFRPADAVCVLRSLWRQRGMLLRSQGRHVQHMQKALTQMNIQLTNVISDVVGETGQKILRAMVAGERDGQVLAKLKNVRIRASRDEIAKSLQGNWRIEHLFALKQALGMFDFIGTQLAECDAQIEQQLQRLHAHDGEPTKGKKPSRARNAPTFDLRTQLFKMCGVDLTRIDGIDVSTALAVIAETGADLSRYPPLSTCCTHDGHSAGIPSPCQIEMYKDRSHRATYPRHLGFAGHGLNDRPCRLSVLTLTDVATRPPKSAHNSLSRNISVSHMLPNSNHHGPARLSQQCDRVANKITILGSEHNIYLFALALALARTAQVPRNRPAQADQLREPPRARASFHAAHVRLTARRRSDIVLLSKKGRLKILFFGAYGPSDVTSQVLRDMSFFLVRNRTSRAEATADGARAIGTVNGQDVVVAAIKSSTDPCDTVSGLLNYPVINNSKQIMVNIIPYVGDACKAEPVSVSITAPAGDPFAAFKPVKVLWAAEFKNAAFSFHRPVAAK